ncbi:unnamed protein product [Rotaria sordida]|uniref:Uncharacterized protein n=1 Tax=Rotaria sordida TaxID=392033 RepID=A0A819J5J1_9BILA|nr:unnamed protein product [Rotaria sordida]
MKIIMKIVRNDDALDFDSASNIEPVNDFYSITSSPSAGSSSSDNDNAEDDIFLQIIDFVRSANLDKVNINRLLRLLNNIHPNNGLPKSANELWEQAGNRPFYAVIYERILDDNNKLQNNQYSIQCPISQNLVLCTLAEVPPPVRDYQRNVMHFGLYHSPI